MLGVVAAVSLALSTGCSDDPKAHVLPTAPSFGKAASGLAVSAATPAFGRQGQIAEQVTISGSGSRPARSRHGRKAGSRRPRSMSSKPSS
jgi:hypothetical protein